MRTKEADLWDDWVGQRNERAFRGLVAPELPHVVAAVRRAGLSGADAEDALQEALAVLARERSTRPAEIGIRAWLVRSAKLRAKTLARGRRRRRRREAAVARPEVARPEAAEPSRRAELTDEVAAALRPLEAKDREAVLLRHLHGMEYRQIAYVLGASQNACRIRVHRAMKLLRERLGLHAGSLLAGLPLPVIRSEAALLKGALAAAPHAAVGATLGTTGVIAMSTGTKIVLTAVLASAVTAGALVGTGTLRNESPAPEAPRAEPAGPGLREAAASGEPPPAGAASLADLRPTGEEVAFLRKALLAERERREVARISPGDSGLDVLRRVLDHGADPTPLLADWDGFAAHVRPAGGKTATFEATGDETEVDLGADPGARVIVFGPGTFRLKRSRYFDFRGAEKSLEIRGAGMDLTRLVWERGSLVFVASALENLVVKDLTISVGDNAILDVRGEAAAVLEGVRFDGWASGHGHGAPLGIGGRSFLGLRGCEFLNGGDGIAISLRGNSLVLAEDCLFADADSAITGWGGAAAKSQARFAGCVFENSRLADNRFLYRDRPEFPLVVEGGRALFGAPDLDPKEREKKWGVEYAASVTGLTFAPGVPRCTARDLLTVLDLAEPRGSEVVVGIRAENPRRGGPPTRWFLSFLDLRSGGFRRFPCELANGRLVERPDRGGGPGGVSVNPENLAGLPRLAEVLRSWGIPAAADVREVMASWNGEHVIWTVKGSGSWWIDAATGEVLQHWGD